MKNKYIALLSIFFVATLNLFALEVNEPELKSVGSEEIVKFENYNGPHSVIESIDTIKSIGSGLGTKVKKAISEYGSYTQNSKYTVIHAIDPNENGKLDADIIFINKNATVDHIKNLRRIISAYLQETYSYNEKDASTVATFVTIYNAVYKGKLDVYKEKYKSVVVKNLTAENCGLSTKWNEWAGKAQIVIPLGQLDSSISAVDTSVISDKKVVESMQEEDDKGVDERKNMVELKEKEAEIAQDKAQESAKKAAEESKKLEEQKKKEDNAKKEAVEAKKEAEEAKKEAEKDPLNKEKQEIAEEKQEIAEEKQEIAEEEEQKTIEQETITEEAKTEATEQQQIADKKQNEAQTERTEIAKDMQEIIQEQIKNENADTVIGLRVSDESQELSEMVKVNALDGHTMKTSPVTVIRARTILPVENPSIENTEEIDTSLLYMAICGENANNGTVKLCLLDTDRMEIQKESTEIVHEKSVLVTKDNAYYCVIQDNNKWVLGKFDKSLNLLLKSTASLIPSTPVIITDKGIVVTAHYGSTLLLKLSDLSEISNDDGTVNIK